MRIITLNCNGIRSAARKGLFAWLCKQRADVLCLQETRARITDLTDPVFFPKRWHVYFNDAQKTGYAGVALYCRQKPDEVLNQLKAAEFDAEGRYLEARFGKLSVISLYLPSGSAGPERQASKDRFLKFFQPKLREWIKCGREFIVCGDWNIAHKEIDLKNWKANQKYSGFLPRERAWLDVAFGPEPKGLGWVDAYRVLHPEHTGEAYTWWSNRGAAWAKNVGWRIDYQLVTPALRSKVRKASIYKAQRFSDHAPLIMDYDL